MASVPETIIDLMAIIAAKLGDRGSQQGSGVRTYNGQRRGTKHLRVTVRWQGDDRTCVISHDGTEAITSSEANIVNEIVGFCTRNGIIVTAPDIDDGSF